MRIILDTSFIINSILLSQKITNSIRKFLKKSIKNLSMEN